ncbi:hypothetical protein QVD17_37706 [Tagetes erecta]|uniref:Uncharacterized protein n=1 Tax=Tagetes erecta TaxID=13708 RepID=A0AAD8JYT1_TARER|nr:hypothetical protein QVD17_37706 [Tagetes erecta]
MDLVALHLAKHTNHLNLHCIAHGLQFIALIVQNLKLEKNGPVKKTAKALAESLFDKEKGRETIGTNGSNMWLKQSFSLLTRVFRVEDPNCEWERLKQGTYVWPLSTGVVVKRDLRIEIAIKSEMASEYICCLATHLFGRKLKRVAVEFKGPFVSSLNGSVQCLIIQIQHSERLFRKKEPQNGSVRC